MDIFSKHLNVLIADTRLQDPVTGRPIKRPEGPSCTAFRLTANPDAKKTKKNILHKSTFVRVLSLYFFRKHILTRGQP